jgi:hypothetical protein
MKKLTPERKLELLAKVHVAAIKFNEAKNFLIGRICEGTATNDEEYSDVEDKAQSAASILTVIAESDLSPEADEFQSDGEDAPAAEEAAEEEAQG